MVLAQAQDPDQRAIRFVRLREFGNGTLCEHGDFAYHADSGNSSVSSAPSRRRLNHPIRLTLAAELGDALDGAWWPYTLAIARELPELVDALHRPLGGIVDIGVNWTPLECARDLDSIHRRGNSAVAGRLGRQQRVMAFTGSHARARLLVVPCQTTTALAVMVMRQAAGLPIKSMHLTSEAFRTAADIVRAARAGHPTIATPAADSV